ncbi:MAG TPA: methyltransferase [Alphaproteobacteria bacterium]
MPHRSAQPGPRTAQAVELVVAALGARGDGIATHDGRPVYVAGALPGERVRARLGAARGDGRAAMLERVLAPAAERVAPACRHFGTCGGCAVQHLARAAELLWKRGVIADALSRRGLADAPVAPARVVAPGKRRRATFVAARAGARVTLGFHQRRSHRLVDIAECPAIMPELEALAAPLRDGLAGVLRDREQIKLHAQATETGIDLVIDAARAPQLAEREALAGLAERLDLARLTWRADGELEPIAWRRPARVSFAGIAVEPPPGAFLQPSADGEAAIRAAVLAAMGPARTVADLFAGVGTLALPLAAQATVAAVHAVDIAGDHLDALAKAARALDRARIGVEQRDLFAAPLAGPELDRFDAVVFDPPRAGARAQAAALAASAVPAVVAVSCDPATFARDARLLVDGGYRLELVTPIDQFPWSAEVELVAAFRRPGSGAGARTRTRSRRPPPAG